MYYPKVHHDGPDKLVIESGGTLDVKAGANVTGIVGVSAIATVQAANVTTIATDLTTTEALANSLKTDLNALIAKLEAAGLMASA
jgi:hypothetical protein